VMLGDATWDCLAATAADVTPVGVLTGGFSANELREAGAVAVVETLEAAGAFLRGWATGGSST
jgi:phosphoglycolate phosphatase-like HAD superfamily hydrolase